MLNLARFEFTGIWFSGASHPIESLRAIFIKVATTARNEQKMSKLEYENIFEAIAKSPEEAQQLERNADKLIVMREIQKIKPIENKRFSLMSLKSPN